MNVPVGTPSHLLARVASSLQNLNPELVKDCGIRTLGFKDLGPSRELYPNHGLYVNDNLILNSQLVEDPTIYKDTSTGKRLDTFDHILYHELGHGWDVQKGGGTELSLPQYEQGTVKLSDAEGKHMGSPEDVELYEQCVKRAVAMGAWAYQLSVGSQAAARELVTA
jgi:hypothetical protein